MEIESGAQTLADSTCGLPIELLEAILDDATFIPNELDISEWTGAYDQLELARKVTHDPAFSLLEMEQSIQTRLSVTRVSSLWRELSLRKCYRTVVVFDGTSISRLSTLMTGRRDLAGMVRRLDIWFGGFNKGHPGHIPQAKPGFNHEDLRSLISLFPNLTDLNVWSEYCSPTSGKLLIPGDSSLSLLRTNLRKLGIGTNHKLSFSCTQGFSALRHLQIRHTHEWYAKDGRYCPMELPNLEVLDFWQYSMSMSRRLDDALFDSSLPRLHTLVISIDRRSLSLPTFWEKYGPQIRTFSARRHSTWEDSEITLAIQKFQHLCSLEQLIVNMIFPPTLLDSMTQNVNIKIFELHPYFYKVPAYRCWQPINPFNVDIASALPRLELFRISNIPSSFNKMYPKSVTQHITQSIDQVIDYMIEYEESIRSRGIKVQLLSWAGMEICSLDELKETRGTLEGLLTGL